MRTRFAPSPTGPLHLGHAYSAMLAHDMARATGGTFLLRIENIDRSRARPEWEELIFEDLSWLGVRWEEPVMRQSDRQGAYDAALDRLWEMGLLYPCNCKRRDILAAANAPQEGEPILGPDGVVYPGTCRPEVAPKGKRPRDSALRLNMSRALEVAKNVQANVPEKAISASTFPTFRELGVPLQRQQKTVNTRENAESDQDLDALVARLTYEAVNTGGGALTYQDVNAIGEGLTYANVKADNAPLTYLEVTTPPMALTTMVGDVVLARRDMGTSYHLSVVVDDAAQDISHVIRGEDLFAATPIHVLLQALLGLPSPLYLHHRLIRDETGKRLAKRDDARAIRLYRDEGKSPLDVRRMVGLDVLS